MDVYQFIRSLPKQTLEVAQQEWREIADSLAETIAIMETALLQDVIRAKVIGDLQNRDENHDNAVLSFLSKHDAPSELIAAQTAIIATEDDGTQDEGVGEIDTKDLLQDMVELQELKARLATFQHLRTTAIACIAEEFD